MLKMCKEQNGMTVRLLISQVADFIHSPLFKFWGYEGIGKVIRNNIYPKNHTL